MQRQRNILSLLVWLVYGLIVATHAVHHVVEATSIPSPSQTHHDEPCSDCVALGALGLLLVAGPRMPEALRQFAALLALRRVPAVIPRAAPRHRPPARGPPR